MANEQGGPPPGGRSQSAGRAHFTKKIWVLTNLAIPDNIRFGHNLMISWGQWEDLPSIASLAVLCTASYRSGIFSDQIAA